MDVIDLWELLSHVEGLSFETFPWDLFALCNTSVERSQAETSTKTSDISQDSVESDVERGVPVDRLRPDQVPATDRSVVQKTHSNQTFITDNCQTLPVPVSEVPHTYENVDSDPSQELLLLLSTDSQDNQKLILGNGVLDHQISNNLPPLQNGDDHEEVTLGNDHDQKNGCEEGEERCCHDPPPVLPVATPPGLTLAESMQALRQALDDRSTLSAFEKLKKKKADEPMDVAKLPDNAPKNRYKDVLPYDAYRVVLTGDTPSPAPDDYINASFVRMALPAPRRPLEYIAAQGPLPHTCEPLWRMLWQQQCGVVVMLTPLQERSRAKCHQYWPGLYQTERHGDLQVTCFSETTSEMCITRDFLIINPVANEERHVMQLQYVNWPDHGVPEDCSGFLDFVQHLRDLRRDVGGYVAVHCSAGVGRTGVLILMETALSYIDADEPLCPLELVRVMRCQRVMMVQTVVQYKFICEAILKAYNDRCPKIDPDD